MAGYSGTPLQKKLGIGQGEEILLVNAPKNYFVLIGSLPPGAVLVSDKKFSIDFIHLFVESIGELENQLPVLRKQVKPDGIIWVSWYKKSAGKKTDVTEDVIRKTALPLGLVDIKVCAVDDNWSGLKLVVRKENRK